MQSTLQAAAAPPIAKHEWRLAVGAFLCQSQHSTAPTDNLQLHHPTQPDRRTRDKMAFGQFCRLTETAFGQSSRLTENCLRTII